MTMSKAELDFLFTGVTAHLEEAQQQVSELSDQVETLRRQRDEMAEQLRYAIELANRETMAAAELRMELLCTPPPLDDDDEDVVECHGVVVESFAADFEITGVLPSRWGKLVGTRVPREDQTDRMALPRH
jgi:hypothetical protein